MRNGELYHVSINQAKIMFTPEYLSFFWLAVGVIFLLLELVTPGLFYFLAFSVGSCCSAFTAFFEWQLLTQLFVFTITALLAFFFMRWYTHAIEKHHVKTNVFALVGMKGIVTKTIDPHQAGRIKVGGEEWPAVAEDGVTLQTGTSIVILRVQGNRLFVRKT